jgi:hypothetical protein
MLEGVEIELDRVSTNAKWLEPTYHCNIQVFLSFANFYRHFIYSFSCLANPFTDMSKGVKNSNFWGPFLSTLAPK